MYKFVIRTNSVYVLKYITRILHRKIIRKYTLNIHTQMQLFFHEFIKLQSYVLVFDVNVYIYLLINTINYR